MLPSCLDLVFLHWISGRSFMLGKALGSRALAKLCLHSSYRLVCPYFGNALNLVLYPTLKNYSQHCVYRRFFHYTHLSFARQFLESRLDHLYIHLYFLMYSILCAHIQSMSLSTTRCHSHFHVLGLDDLHTKLEWPIWSLRKRSLHQLHAYKLTRRTCTREYQACFAGLTGPKTPNHKPILFPLEKSWGLEVELASLLLSAKGK